MVGLPCISDPHRFQAAAKRYTFAVVAVQPEKTSSDIAGHIWTLVREVYRCTAP